MLARSLQLVFACRRVAGSLKCLRGTACGVRDKQGGVPACHARATVGAAAHLSAAADEQREPRGAIARACFGGKPQPREGGHSALLPAGASESECARRGEWRTRAPCPTTQPGGMRIRAGVAPAAARLESSRGTVRLRPRVRDWRSGVLTSAPSWCQEAVACQGSPIPRPGSIQVRRHLRRCSIEAPRHLWRCTPTGRGRLGLRLGPCAVSWRVAAHFVAQACNNSS
jgi:hypothetical protein